MKTVVGILKSPSDARRAVDRLRTIGVTEDRINVLAPDASKHQLASIPTTETEQPGTGSALGGVVGGAVGAAGGISLGTAIASLFVPGIGTVLAVGLAGAAILGGFGAAAGALSGRALEDSMAVGLPIDELFVYEDALRQGRTIVIAFVDDEERAELVRQSMREIGAESVDAARENWWVGLRDDERVAYTKHYDRFEENERGYRHGFEWALHPAARGKTYEEAMPYLRASYPKEYAGQSFRLGYERGYAHYLELLARSSTKSTRATPSM